MKTNTLKRTKTVLAATFVLIAIPMLLAACGSSSSSTNPDGSVNVNVTLTDFGIESSLNTFEVGIPYHFIITNKGAINHELMIMVPTMAGSEMAMEEMDKMALAFVEEDELPPGATQTLDYTFTDSASAGSLEFACHTVGHYEAGMISPITVK